MLRPLLELAGYSLLGLATLGVIALGTSKRSRNRVQLPTLPDLMARRGANPAQFPVARNTTISHLRRGA